MKKIMLCSVACAVLLFQSFPLLAYTPEAVRVVNTVYAIIGPLGQRNADNDGLNNNLGFIVTDQGVILIDSGASYLGAEKIHQAIKAVTAQPVKWVINTGSQDHRWLGNDYFARQGADIIALTETVKTQKQFARQHLDTLKGFLGDRLRSTRALPATRVLKGDEVKITLGNQTLMLTYTHAHFNGDIMVWLPDHKVIFTGDLVYVDRLVALLPESSVRNAQAAFAEMEKLQPDYIVPGHGRVCDLEQARKESGDYYTFLTGTIGAAAEDMEPMADILDKYSSLPAFEHLEHFNELHRKNMNRTYLEFESF